jgi:glucose uptake protein
MLGLMANTQKLASSNWRFELFYWDYVIGILITSLLFAFTLGSMGEGGRGFLVDIKQADNVNIYSAIIGGIVFNLANILLGAAISIAGMSVAFPVGIGLALVVGVIVNYIDAPIGNSTFIFVGVALIVIAILLNANAYRKMLAGNTASVSTKGLLFRLLVVC